DAAVAGPAGLDVLVVAGEENVLPGGAAVGGLVDGRRGAVAGPGDVGHAGVVGGHRNEEWMGNVGHAALGGSPTALADGDRVDAFGHVSGVAADAGVDVAAGSGDGEQPGGAVLSSPGEGEHRLAA